MIHGLLLGLSALVQQGVGEIKADLFLPAFEYKTKSLTEWASIFEGGGEGSGDALWCIYYWDDRSDPVCEVLRSRLGEELDPEVVGDIEAILNHWGVEHVQRRVPSVPRPEWIDDGEGFALQTIPFSPPIPPLDRGTEDLLAALEGNDAVNQARAAIALIGHEPHVERAVHALVRSLARDPEWWSGRTPENPPRSVLARDVLGLALEWCIEFAGTAADQALIRLLADEKAGDDLRRFILEKVSFSTHSEVGVFGPTLLELSARDDDVGDLAVLKALFMVLGWNWDIGHLPGHGTPYRSASWPVSVSGLDAPAEEDLIASALTHYLTRRIRSGTLRVENVRDSIGAFVFSARVRERIAPTLWSLTERADDVGVAALYGLCWAGVDTPDLRRRYIEVIDRVRDVSDATIRWIPCLATHNGATRSALERLYARAASMDRSAFLWPFAIGGLLDPGVSEVGQRFLDDLVDSTDSLWFRLYGLGYRGEPAVRDSDGPMDRLMKHAIAVRTMREQGKDPATRIEALLEILRKSEEPYGRKAPSEDHFHTGYWIVRDLDLADREFLDASLEFMLDTKGFHQRSTARMLHAYPLDRRQQAILCQASSYHGVRHFWPVLAAQGEASLERVGEIRALMAEGVRDFRARSPRLDLDILAAVLQITRASVQEESWLAKALRSGVCADRVTTLDLIRTHRVDTPAIRRGVKAAIRDVDSRVREAAVAASLELGE